MSDQVTHYRKLLGMARGWAMANLPGWADELHRDLLMRHGAGLVEGRYSATTMSAEQLRGALADYTRRGWPRQQGKDGKPVPPRIAHMVRLWGKLGQAGKVQQSTRPALLAFCARQVGHEVRDLDSLAVGECQRVTEALKSWLARA